MDFRIRSVNARYVHTAVGVQQFLPGVSNNSLRIHCAVNPLAKTPLYESRSQNLRCGTCNARLCCAVFPAHMKSGRVQPTEAPTIQPAELPSLRNDLGTLFGYFSCTMLWCSWKCWIILGPLSHGSRPCFPMKRLHYLFPVGCLYGAWTYYLPYDLPHADGSADAAGMAAGYHDLGGACSTGPDSLTPG